MIVLDTNILSEFSGRELHPEVRRWLARQRFDEISTCAPVMAELAFGAQRIWLRDRSKRYLAALNRVIVNVVMGRVFGFDLPSALKYGEIRAEEERKGRPRENFDLMIAAICMVNGATLATKNATDFSGLDLKVVNPFEAA